MKIILTVLINFLTMLGFSQPEIPPVDVAELTVKIGALSTEVLYYGFAEGDQIIFSFEEVNGKPIKEIEIIELPTNSKFADFKASQIKNKKITAHKTAVYSFEFRNSAMIGRICKIKIQRIPKSKELIGFNTNWEWKTIYDTSYTAYTKDSLVGYDTIWYKETIKELIKTVNTEDMIMDRTERVHSYWNSNSSYTYIRVNIPEAKRTKYRKERVIGWVYWIGVGDESRMAYAQNVQAIGKMTSSIIGITSPLGALGVGVATELLTPKSGDDVSFAFMSSYENAMAYINHQPYYNFDKAMGVIYIKTDLFYANPSLALLGFRLSIVS